MCACVRASTDACIRVRACVRVCKDMHAACLVGMNHRMRTCLSRYGQCDGCPLVWEFSYIR